MERIAAFFWTGIFVGLMNGLVVVAFRLPAGLDSDALVALLDPNAVLRADSAAVSRPRANLQPEVRGARAVAGAFAGRATGAQTAIIDGFVGAVWAVIAGGRPLAAFEFRVAHGKIASIEVVADAERLGEMELDVLV